ncbi:M20/M25/M40 family metallo-hydrolase [Aquimarina sp. ERC-38]|uniref:M20/M25/M40 family metallo-hydrolase n=1 Tax=Aquimarina sp. ERC-38 TaxID=2949996 RepID=UPI0022484EBF|nr:M20/M25/M40 family metallo-hydrolase [Aquimarina sp. ERC-38]UZO82442.1 M20/M25/M40 family metallo-hydrolase [Aquimarina sp. ERC-38]
MITQVCKYALFLPIIIVSFLFHNCESKKETVEASEPVKEDNSSTDDSSDNNKVTEAERILSFLADDALQGRDSGSKGLEKAADFIQKELTSYGVVPFKTSYLDTFVAQGENTYNVLGYLPGNDSKFADEMVIIGAHYDHIGTAKAVAGDIIANGANDNASGTTAVLLLAKKLAEQKSNKRSVLFALFSAEEKGLIGSKHLAKELKEAGKDVYVMLNFEMIGVPLNDKDYTAYITGFELSNFAEKINEYSKQPDLIGFLPKAKEFNLFRRSDNYPIYESLNIPSQTISTFDFTNYDYYHHVDDEASQMNYPFINTLVEKITPAVTMLTQTETKEIKFKQ